VGVNSSEDARHCSVLYICKYIVGLLYKSVEQEGEFSGVVMPGIYVVKFFAVVQSLKVVCRFFAMIHSTRVCAGGRVLACNDAWHLHGEVFCNGSLYKSCVQEGEFWRLLMPGIYLVKYFAIVCSTRVLCRRESSGMC
jgi:hypothetical protein